MKTIRMVSVWAILSGACMLSACGESNDAPKAEPKAQIPAAFLLKAAPANARSVLAVKADAKQGDEVVMVGRVGGRKEPFVAERAMLTLVDSALPDCGVPTSSMPNCKTPWDYCCDEPSVVIRNAATVQVVGADGKTLKAELKNLGEMKAGSTVIVVGIVSQKSDDALLVNATGLFVDKR